MGINEAIKEEIKRQAIEKIKQDVTKRVTEQVRIKVTKQVMQESIMKLYHKGFGSYAISDMLDIPLKFVLSTIQ
jgi:hypothetical protein